MIFFILIALVFLVSVFILHRSENFFEAIMGLFLVPCIGVGAALMRFLPRKER